MKMRTMKHMLLTSLCAGILFFSATDNALAQKSGDSGGGNKKAQISEKLAELRGLITEKQQAGQNVDRAIQLHQQADEAIRRGDADSALTYLNSAITGLRGTSATPTPTQTKGGQTFEQVFHGKQPTAETQPATTGSSAAGNVASQSNRELITAKLTAARQLIDEALALLAQDAPGAEIPASAGGLPPKQPLR